MGKAAKKSEVVRALGRLIAQSGLNEAACRERRRTVEADAWNVVAQLLRFEAEQVAVFGVRWQPQLFEVGRP